MMTAYIGENDVYNFLDGLGISYEILRHKPVYTVEEAAAELPGRTELKNLFVQDDKGKRQYLVVMPGMKRLDLKRLAADLDEKKVRFCSPEKVQTMLGVKPGSVSIFCCLNYTSQHVKVIIDQELMDEPELGFHPIINTASVYMATEAIHTILANISQESVIQQL